eukprot:9968685-Lingulodinium_polyedra.AAC.1
MSGDREANCVAGGQEKILHLQGPTRAAAQPSEVVDKNGAADGAHDGVIAHVPHEGAGRSAHAHAASE